MEYLIEGKLQFDEYFDTHKKAAQVRRSILRTVMVLLGLSIIVLYLRESVTFTLASSLQLTVGITLIVYGLVISPLQFRYRVQRNWNRFPAAHRQCRFSFDTSGMTSFDDFGNKSVTKWNYFIKLRESKSSFMLFMSPLLWIVVPKRLLGFERVEEFRVFVSSLLDKENQTES
jgi:hypothetical protein